MGIVWTPELKKEAWITRKKNIFMKKGASEEIALRDAKELFDKSGMANKWENDSKPRTQIKYNLNSDSTDGAEVEDEVKKAIELLMREKNITYDEACKILNDAEEKKAIEEELAAGIESSNIFFVARDIIVKKDRLNWILVHKGRTTYHNKVSYLFEAILASECRLAKDRINDVKEIIQIIKSAEQKVIEVGEAIDRKLSATRKD